MSHQFATICLISTCGILSGCSGFTLGIAHTKEASISSGMYAQTSPSRPIPIYTRETLPDRPHKEIGILTVERESYSLGTGSEESSFQDDLKKRCRRLGGHAIVEIKTDDKDPSNPNNNPRPFKGKVLRWTDE